jgi:hypothetical protein
MIVLQPSAPDDFKGTVNWSKLKDYQRMPFVLVHERHGDVRPVVFYGEEGALGNFKWRKNKPDEARLDENRRVRKVATALYAGRFEVTIDDWMCDRCPSRIICPCWITPPQDSTVNL